MRAVLIIGACLSVSGCDVFYVAEFDIHRMQEWRLCTAPDGREVEAQISVDPAHCGRCGNACGEGVVCVDSACEYSSRIHCGGAGRTCVGFTGGVDVDCVYVGQDEDYEPALGPVVRGYVCAPVASVPMPPVEEPPTAPVGEEPPGPVEQVVGDPPLAPDWILTPGRSTNCRDAVDDRCYFTEVEVEDVCGEICTARIEHDFELMTTEMSRAMYREALECVCGGVVESPRCVELCEDDEANAARPITGLSWCEAYEACQAVGGRLPTVIERARVEAMVDVDRGLFSRPEACGDWIAQTGAAPRVAECFDRPQTLEMDAVDGWDGAVPIGTAVLPKPRYFHHLYGNAYEWLADPVGGATCAALTQSRPWGVSEEADEFVRPRMARGRSLYSPAGEPGDHMIALDPGAQATEVGVRCARTSVDTAPEPMPYDGLAKTWEHAECNPSVVGHRSVRQSAGERVLRARAVCVDRPTTIQSAGWLASVAEALFAKSEQVALARHAFGYFGPIEIGQARFAPDEQWWVAEPAREPGDSTDIIANEAAVTLRWEGEYDDLGPSCVDRMEADRPESRTDGRLIIGQSFVVDRSTLAPFTLRGTREDAGRMACGALDCAEWMDPEAPCEAGCETWHLPVVVEFERVEPMDRTALCGAPETD